MRDVLSAQVFVLRIQSFGCAGLGLALPPNCK